MMVLSEAQLENCRYEIIMRFMYEGLRAGMKEQKFSFKEWRLHKALPFLLEDLAMAHNPCFGFKMDKDGNYPALSASLARMEKERYISVECVVARVEVYTFSIYAVEGIPRWLEENKSLDDSVISALKESFPRTLRAFIRNANYGECVHAAGFYFHR